MTLHLSSAEQKLLSEAVRACSSPLAFENSEEWAYALIANAQKAVGGLRGMIEAPSGSGLAVTAGLSASEHAEYHRYMPLLTPTRLFERAAGLRVATRKEAYGPHFKTVMQHEFGQEFLPRIKAYDSLILTYPLRPDPRDRRDVIQLIFNSTEPERPVTDRQVRIARLFYPALEAGIRTHGRLEPRRHRLAELLDASGGACAVLGSRGTLLHCTPAFEKVLMREPKRDDLMDCVRCIASSFHSADMDHMRAAVSDGRFNGVRGRYTITPTFVHEFADAPSILVTVTAPRSRMALPDASALRDRFNLTPQESRVALHLAERRTNKEIAAALSISIHTAQHHVRHTLEKLGVPRRNVSMALQESM